jgi:hypothetical protein
MQLPRFLYLAIYAVTAVLFGVCAVGLLVLVIVELLPALDPTSDLRRLARFDAILEAVGVLTITVACAELSQTVVEEEILRNANMSTPTRVRRFMSRFLVVVVVGAAVEFLIAVFKLLHDDPSRLPAAGAIGVTAAILLLAWGAFVRWNLAAEKLEPEALAHAKREDHKVT